MTSVPQPLADQATIDNDESPKNLLVVVREHDSVFPTPNPSSGHILAIPPPYPPAPSNATLKALLKAIVVSLPLKSFSNPLFLAALNPRDVPNIDGRVSEETNKTNSFHFHLLINFCSRVQRLSQDNRIKQRRAWLLLGRVTAERSCPCKQPVCRPLVVVRKTPLSRWSPRLSVTEGFLPLTSPALNPLSFLWPDSTLALTRTRLELLLPNKAFEASYNNSEITYGDLKKSTITALNPASLLQQEIHIPPTGTLLGPLLRTICFLASRGFPQQIMCHNDWGNSNLRTQFCPNIIGRIFYTTYNRDVTLTITRNVMFPSIWKVSYGHWKKTTSLHLIPSRCSMSCFKVLLEN
ncbi:hypothetical protein J6590_062118 [Homalodisca vitripennis]|nr:hypothetical protein J6590_062118 [Homalodisca vitripennis]